MKIIISHDLLNNKLEYIDIINTQHGINTFLTSSINYINIKYQSLNLTNLHEQDLNELTNLFYYSDTNSHNITNIINELTYKDNIKNIILVNINDSIYILHNIKKKSWLYNKYNEIKIIEHIYTINKTNILTSFFDDTPTNEHENNSPLILLNIEKKPIWNVYINDIYYNNYNSLNDAYNDISDNYPEFKKEPYDDILETTYFIKILESKNNFIEKNIIKFIKFYIHS